MLNFSLFDRDRKFLQSLGIEYTGEPSFSPVVVGTVKIISPGDDEDTFGLIELSVSAWPATFWKAQITTTEGKYINLGTGSGHLSDFWPTFVLFAKGMIGVTE